MLSAFIIAWSPSVYSHSFFVLGQPHSSLTRAFVAVSNVPNPLQSTNSWVSQPSNLHCHVCSRQNAAAELVDTIIRLLLTQHCICVFLLAHTFSSVHSTNWLSALRLRPSIADMGDRPDGSCPQNPPLNIDKCTKFSRSGCTVYGYLSSGGVLMRDVNVVDMQLLQLDRFSEAQRSSNKVQEDEFCARMRKGGATW